MFRKKGLFESIYRTIKTINMNFEEDFLFRCLRDINQYIEYRNYGFKIEVINPSIVPDHVKIEEYIRSYCHENLPANQFKGIQQHIEDLMETGGRFIIKEGIAQLTYQATPSSSEVRIGLNGGTSSTVFIPITDDEQRIADSLVEWHIHPFRFSYILSIPGDIDFINNSIKLSKSKPYIHVCYSTVDDKFVWYQPMQLLKKQI